MGCGNVYEGDFVEGQSLGRAPTRGRQFCVMPLRVTSSKVNALGRALNVGCGAVYEGDWLDGELTGIGTYTWADGKYMRVTSSKVIIKKAPTRGLTVMSTRRRLTRAHRQRHLHVG